MKRCLPLVFALFSIVTYSQNGSISGTLTDKEFNDEPLAFANILITGTTNYLLHFQNSFLRVLAECSCLLRGTTNSVQNRINL